MGEEGLERVRISEVVRMVRLVRIVRKKGLMVGYKFIEKMGNCESVDESKIQVPRQGAVS